VGTPHFEILPFCSKIPVLCARTMDSKQDSNIAHELQFNVAQLLKETTGATRDHDIYFTGVNQFDELELVEPLTGSVYFLRTGQDVLVTGKLHTTLQRVCGKCLASFTAPITIVLEEIFFPTIDLVSGNMLPAPEDADEANRINEFHTLDLYEVIRQAIMLESVACRYCRPDCKGLCPHCGQDRNTNPCTCHENAIDARWSGLLEVQIEE